MCQRLPKDYTKEDFKDAHGFRNDWQQVARSNEDRYRTPEAFHKRLREESLEEEQVTRMFARLEYMAVMSPREREVVSSNLAMLDHYDEIRKQGPVRGRFMDDGTDSSPVTMAIEMMTDIFQETSVTIRVCNAHFLRGGRWYLGHPPGTYILKYRGLQSTGTGLNTFMGAPAYITQNDFEYVGQVPRHEIVYKTRLRLLLREVLRLFISEIQSYTGLWHQNAFPDLERLLSLRVIESAQDFEKVWVGWERVRTMTDDEWPDAEMRKNFVSRPVILELSWLLNTFKCRYSGTNELPHVLEKLVFSATDKHLPELARMWSAMERATALDKLRSGKRSGLFVYEATPETEVSNLTCVFV